MKKKRFLNERNIIIVRIVLSIIVLAIAFGGSKLIYNIIGEKDEAKILEEYESQKERCELIKSLSNCIQKGKGINIYQIPDNIRYEIKSQDDGNIHFYYCIKDAKETSNPYYANIILSKDYEIIEEEYGCSKIEEKDFETYLQKYEEDRIFTSRCISALVAVVFQLIVTLFLIKHNIENKKSRS